MPAPRKPTKLKLLQGTAQKCRLNPDEPEPATGEMTAPAYLSAKARANFDKFAADLDAIGVCSPSFNAVTAVAAIHQETVENCDIYLQAYFKRERCYSYTTSNSFGDKIHKPVPEMAIRSDATQKLKGCLSDMGLTPSGIGKVSSKKKAPERKNKFA